MTLPHNEQQVKKNINELDNLELFGLYEQVIKMRIGVLELVQKYGYDASSLVSRKFEHDIEQIYGRKILKTTKQEVESQ